MIATADEFAALYSSDDFEEKYRLTHDSASEAIWLAVLENYPNTAIGVVRNKTVPVSILHKLAKSSDPDIRWAVASKRKLDRELFEALARDDDESVRMQIARNRKTPRDILLALSQDPIEGVAEIARQRLKETPGQA